MDPRWQPPLDHLPAPIEVTAEARGLFASGWHAAEHEGRIVNLANQAQQRVSPQTWAALRELAARAPEHPRFAA